MKNQNVFTKQSQVRVMFWGAHPQFQRINGYEQNDYPTDVRCAFVDFVDSLARSGEISQELAARITLA